MADLADVLQAQREADEVAAAIVDISTPELVIAAAIDALRLEIRAFSTRLDYLYHDSKKR